MTSLEDAIKKGRNSLSAERLDMSFGELINMYSSNELIIDPEFQRLFRWNVDQRTRFIESLLLGIPIPSIFVAENDDGVWEIVDGLQRLSTVLSFFGMLKNTPDKNDWILGQGNIVKELDGYSASELPLKFQLNIKRSVCRVEIIKWDSNYDMRYELFNRLNTGGSPLTDQEIRNCIYRGSANEFTELIKELAASEKFCELIQPTPKQAEELYLDELVLRFFALYENHQSISKKLSDHMTDYMKSVSEGEVDYTKNIEIFNRVVNLLEPIGKSALRGGNGQFSTSLYDGVFIGIAQNIDKIEGSSTESLKLKIEKLKIDDDFKKVSGVASNHKERVKKRIARAIEIFL